MMNDKLIVYLDQNFISDIAKQDLPEKATKINPALLRLFKVLKQGVDEEKFLVPDSWIQAIETAAKNDEQLQAAVKSYQGYLGQVSLNGIDDIKEEQFLNAVFEHCGKPEFASDLKKTAFKENPNRRLENYRVTASMSSHFNISTTDTVTLIALNEIRKNGVKYHEQYSKEIEAQRAHYRQQLSQKFKGILLHYEIPIECAEDFIASTSFSEIPYIDIYARLWAIVLSDSTRLTGNEGDMNDINFLSAYLPYSDVIGTDKYMAAKVASLGLDVKYKCQVYNLKQKSINMMIEYLEKEIKERAPANISLFSVICIPTDKKGYYSPNLLQKLNLARNKFIKTGKHWKNNDEIYIPIFLVYDDDDDDDEIELPDNEKIREFGLPLLSDQQASELKLWGYNFEKIYNLDGKSIADLISKIPSYKLGAACAILSEDSDFDNDVVEHDSYLMYDIEEAINKGVNKSSKYGIDVIFIQDDYEKNKG